MAQAALALVTLRNVNKNLHGKFVSFLSALAWSTFHCSVMYRITHCLDYIEIRGESCARQMKIVSFSP